MDKVIILGSGCAGWTAAIYAARAELEPIVITGYELGGQLTLTSVVENWPGSPEGIMGPELMQNMQKQAEKYGTKVIMDKAESFEVIEGGYEIKTSKEAYRSKSVIIATGASARWLGIESETKFKGRGVHTCATCDGFFYKDKEIIVVGGGDSACEEATFLTKHAVKVHLVHRRDELRASKIMQEKVFANPKIEMIWNKEISEFKGDKNLSSVMLKDTQSGEETEMEIDGVFLGLGHTPNTSMFKDKIELDEVGYIKNAKTKLPGVFAAGDVTDKIYRQAITAAGSGCSAALEAEKYLEEN